MAARRSLIRGPILVDEETEDEGEETGEEDEETEEETEGEEEDGDIVRTRDSSRVSHNAAPISIEEGGGEICSTSGSQEKDWNRTDLEGLFCPICMEAWTSGGDHCICCLPCGHVYGFSCIKKWLQQRRSSRKCPQCNRKSSLQDVRKLFASRIATVDEESHKRILSLEVKCNSLEKKNAEWCIKEADWQKREFELTMEVEKLRKRTGYMENLLGDQQTRVSGPFVANNSYQGRPLYEQSIGREINKQEYSWSFMSQEELRVDGARLFDIDTSSQIILLARRLPGMGGQHVLTKMSLTRPHETEDIVLSPGAKTIKDLCMSPHDYGLALFASLGKNLSVLSMESSNVILAYDLPAAAWSCSWDLNNSHYIYAGLQNGLLLVFDMRQTVRPVESLNGLTNNPIHTIHSILEDSSLPSGVRAVLTASSIGVCQWNIGGANERPLLVPQTENQGVCISCAYSPNSDDIVASYRPRVDFSNEICASQILSTPSPVNGHGLQGSHVHLRRARDGYHHLGSTYASVPNIRLPKTIIIDGEKQKKMLASWDESACELILQEFPSFSVIQRFKSANCPIHDLKYARLPGQGLLGLLSEDRLQLFTSKMP